MTAQEHADLIMVDTSGAWEFSGALDLLEAAKRVERYDIDPNDGSYRLRTTELGRLALKLYPTIRT